MNRKIKLTGVRNIPLVDDIDIKQDIDYLLSLRVARVSEEKLDGHGTEAEEVTIFKLKVINPEAFQEIGASQIKIRKGYTKSQELRSAINDMILRKGEDKTEENYNKVMDEYIRYSNEKYL